jgi:hypothetical protein
MSPSSDTSTPISKTICNDGCCCCCMGSSGSHCQTNNGQQQKDSAKTRLPIAHSGEKKN